MRLPQAQIWPGREVEDQLVGPEGQRYVQVQRRRGHRGSGDPPCTGLEAGDSLRCELELQ